MMRWTCLLVVIFTCLAAAARGENWPGWRGLRGDGTSLETNVPVSWNAAKGENIAWKAPIPGIGHASPVVWEDCVLLVTCLPDSQERILLCLDRASGRELWRQIVVRAPLETKHALNSFASSTPATDGKLIF